MKNYLFIALCFTATPNYAKKPSIDINKETTKKYLEEVVNNQRLDLLKKIFTNDSVMVKGKSVTQIKNKEDFLPYLFKAFPDITIQLMK